MEKKVILDLCGGTGAWSKPYKDAGYDVFLVDINSFIPQDVRLLSLKFHGLRGGWIYGVLAAPPCTHLAGSGARWWKEKGDQALLEALSIADACLRIILMVDPIFWCLENPVGRLSSYLGKPELIFDPCDYGDPYTKKTCLWGKFNIPNKNPVKPVEGSKIHKYPPSKDRAIIRSITPSGFAQAFFEANK